MGLRETRKMEEEWQAWQVVVARWGEVIGESMNEHKYDPLLNAIRAWGEVLVSLRLMQPEHVREAALNTALDAREN